MQIGIDSFAAAFDETSQAVDPSDRLRNVVEQIEHADQVGLDVFGIGDLAEAAQNYSCLKKAWVEFLAEPPDMPADRVETT